MQKETRNSHNIVKDNFHEKMFNINNGYNFNYELLLLSRLRSDYN